MSTKIGWEEIQDVAEGLCGLENAERDEIDKAFYEKYDIDLEQFEKIGEDLFKLLSLGISPLTDTPFIGFSKVDKKGFGFWLFKKDIGPEFISAVLQWMGADKMKPKSKGVIREITSGGKIEFTITVEKPKEK